MLQKITDLLNREWEVIIKRAYCEANYCVDKLVNMGITMDLGVHWLSSPPRELLLLLQVDNVGASLPRYCILH